MSVAAVMGASRGLGLLCAHRLARSGHHVVVCSRSQERCDRARDHLIAKGIPAERVSARACDVRDSDAVNEHLDWIETHVGPIDIGLHVAGVIQVGPWQAWEREDFHEAIDTMLWGPINFAVPLAERMTRRGAGRIGIVSSLGGMIAAPHLLPYVTAKFAARGFSQALSAELAGTGVTVTTVAPGLMRVGSHLAAEFAGDRQAEYQWFATAASAPLLAIDADVAARRIVNAVGRGRRFVTFTPAGYCGARFAGIAPGLTTRLMGLVARALPADVARAGTKPGNQVESELTSHRRLLVQCITTLGARAARRNLEQSSPRSFDRSDASGVEQA